MTQASLLEQPTTAAARPAWPTWIGVLSISSALLDLSCAVCSKLFSNLFSDMLKNSATTLDLSSLSGATAIQLPTLQPLAAYLAPPGWICSALLLLGGCLLIARKPTGRLLHLIYSALGLLIAIISASSTLYVVATFNPPSARQFPEAMQTVQMFRLCGYVFAALVALFAGGYPAFLLLYFRRKHVREEVARWQKPKVAA